MPSASERPAAITREQELEAALEELLDVASRMRAGDPNLNPERWYAASEYALIILKREPKS